MSGDVRQTYESFDCEQCELLCKVYLPRVPRSVVQGQYVPSPVPLLAYIRGTVGHGYTVQWDRAS